MKEYIYVSRSPLSIGLVNNDSTYDTFSDGRADLSINSWLCKFTALMKVSDLDNVTSVPYISHSHHVLVRSEWILSCLWNALIKQFSLWN